MSKKSLAIHTYQEPDKYEGQCTLCGRKNIDWDYDKKMKASPFGNMYCGCVRGTTTHTNIKKVKV